ncbi:MAG: hypothetical protein ACFFB0_03860 [Promethearchaeota archaeon]
MVNFSAKRNKFYKHIAISALIVGFISVGIMTYAVRLFWIGPRCTTNFYHFNIDYRLGSEEVEETIIREPYFKLLSIYEKHPKWKFTIECQAELIYRVFNEVQFKEIKDLSLELINHGQMELICGIQFSQLIYMYPADVFELNLEYANKTLDAAGILDKRSRCILFQEGQFCYGLATLLNSKWTSNIDTVLASTQQIRDFRFPGYSGADSPVFDLINTGTGKKINVLQYDYLPKWEAGYMHSWCFELDAELALEVNNWEKKGLPEFFVDDKKVKAYEEELVMLEMEGNKFMTCTEWVNHCESKGAVKKLDYYIPECNWGTTRYNSSYIWAANNGDSADDGIILANNYRCRNIIIATKGILNQYYDLLDIANQTIITEKLQMAEKLWLQATCTDSTGIGPDPLERHTAMANIITAEKNCSQILTILADNFNEIDVNLLQYDLKTEEFFTDIKNFKCLITVLDSDLSLNDLPINVVYSSRVDNGVLNPEILVSRVKFNSSDLLNRVFNLTRLDISFNGTYDWLDDSIRRISIKFKYPNRDFEEIGYSPSLLENYLKRLHRDDYKYHPVYIFLPLSNGLLFIPSEPGGKVGIAIVKNVTARHTSWLWQKDYVEVYEDEGLHMMAHHQFYIMNNVSLDTALAFATRINIYPTWIVSRDFIKMQGFDIFLEYNETVNQLKEGEQGSGEWW